MGMLTIRNVPDEVHRALRARAARNGRSTEAEVREILAVAVKPQGRVLPGEALAELGRSMGLTDEVFDVLDHVRTRSQPDPVSFEP